MFLETACRVIFRPTAAEVDFKRTSYVLYASILGVNLSTHFCANMRIYLSSWAKLSVFDRTIQEKIQQPPYVTGKSSMAAL